MTSYEMMTRVKLKKSLRTNQCSFHPILINLHKSKELFLISQDFLYPLRIKGIVFFERRQHTHGNLLIFPINCDDSFCWGSS